MVKIILQNICGMRNIDRLKYECGRVECDVWCVQECRWSEKVVNEIRGSWEEELYVSLAGDGKAGVAVFVRDRACEGVNLVFKDGEGRVLVVDLIHNGICHRVINVYGPNTEGERKRVFTECRKWTDENTVVVGDFNVVLTKMDIGRQNVFKQDGSRAVMFEWMDECGLVDAWRILNPSTRGLSRRQVVEGVLKQSRLDLGLLSSRMMRLLDDCKYEYWAGSDDASLIVTLGGETRQRNGGLWCFNASLLEDAVFVSRMRSLLSGLLDESHFVDNVIEWWERTKLLIKKRCIVWGREKRMRDNEMETRLRGQISRELELIEGDDSRSVSGYLGLRESLRQWEQQKCKRAMIRSKMQHMLEGERCTAFFLGLEKKRQKRAYISRLRDEKGEMHENVSDILDIVHDFYKQLFSAQSITSDSVERVVGCKL